MNEQNPLKKEKAAVSLALQLDSGKRQIRGMAPTDAELAAFYEQRLDSQRREQVLSHLANDPSMYKKWLALVEAAHASTEHLVDQTSVEPISIIQQVGRWFKANTATTLSGTGFAAAAALVLMINIGDDSSGGIDGLYNQYGQQWSMMPEMPLPVRGMGGMFGGPEKTEQRKILESGLLSGLEMLGPQFIVEGVDRASLTKLSGTDTSLEKAQYSVFFEAGQLAALSHFKCQLTDSAEYYQASRQVAATLVDSLETVQVGEAAQLVESYKQHQSQVDVVCAFSEAALAIIRAK